MYCFITFLFPAILRQTISLKPILSQYNPNNWLYIVRHSIANMLHQYYTIIGYRYEANANIANVNPISSQCGLTRECQRQYANGKPTLGQYIHVVWVVLLLVFFFFFLVFWVFLFCFFVLFCFVLFCFVFCILFCFALFCFGFCYCFLFVCLFCLLFVVFCFCFCFC